MFMYSCGYVCSVYSVFIVPTGTLRLPRLRFFRAFSSVVRQMPGYDSQRRGTVRTLPINCAVLSIVRVQMCTVLLAPGVNPTAVNKYIYLQYEMSWR